MKLKGISFWEQNVEKIFLGVVGVGVLGGLAYQYVLQNSAVQVGKDTVAPEKSFEPVAKAARELKGKLDSPDPKLPDVPSVDLAQRYEQLVTGPVSPVRSNYPIGKGTNLKIDDITENKGDRVFAEVMIPAPSGSVAHAFRSTVSPYEVIRAAEVKSILPAEQPFDKAAASVEATFDGTALKAAMQADPDEGGPIEPLLASWWRDTEIIGVELERQQQNSDGSWADATIVPAMPGRVDLLGDVKTKVKSTGDLPLILATARSQPDAVQRAPYYATISGVEWKPPADLADLGPAGEGPKDERGRLVQRIADLEQKYAKVQQQMADAGKAAGNRPRAQQPAAGAGAGRRGGGASPSAQTPSGPTKTPLERSSELLVLQVDRARKELEAFDAKLAAATGVNPAAAATAPGTPAAPLALMDNPRVRLWSHDVTVEQGKTYRYRVRIAVNNPLFGRTASLKPEQAKLATDAVSRGEWSEWSDPITVDPSEFYFVTSASERDNLGPTRASAELYKFYYGYYRRGTVTVEPGDTLSADMKLPDGLKLYDITKLATANPELVQVPAAAAPAPGGGANDEGRGRGRMFRTEQDRGAAEAGRQAPPPPAQVANTPPADGLWKPAPKSMKMAVDALLLDVGPVALAQQTGLGTKSEQITQAFLRVTDGAIQVRVPRQDQADPAYQRLRRNSEAGEQASKAKDADPAGINVPPPPPVPGPGDVRPQPPGGGGGGGGG